MQLSKVKQIAIAKDGVSLISVMVCHCHYRDLGSDGKAIC